MKTEVDYTKLIKIGTYRNNWRERIVTLFEHPTDPTRVISVGAGIHDNKEVVCNEAKENYHRQLINNDWSTFN